MKHWPKNDLLPSEVTKCGLPISTVTIGDDFYDFDCTKCNEIVMREMGARIDEVYVADAKTRGAL